MAPDQTPSEAGGHPFHRQSPQLSEVVHRNIEALLEVRRVHQRQKGAEERAVDAITRFAGSMRFVYVHAVLFGGWILINLGLMPGVRPFDPFPFVMLAMFASVEAIFLSTFVLISQNRMAALADRRADLDLQVSLLAEHEVTRLIHMVDTLARRLGVEDLSVPDMDELKKDVPPEAVLQEIEDMEKEWDADEQCEQARNPGVL
jgi:uncharacterized membrane protein